jgi:hypothetical protein
MYVVLATSKDRKIGRLAAEVATKDAALKSARHLRKQGFVVTVTGPDGRPVDETEQEPKPPGL